MPRLLLDLDRRLRVVRLSAETDIREVAATAHLMFASSASDCVMSPLHLYPLSPSCVTSGPGRPTALCRNVMAPDFMRKGGSRCVCGGEVQSNKLAALWGHRLIIKNG